MFGLQCTGPPLACPNAILFVLQWYWSTTSLSLYHAVCGAGVLVHRRPVQMPCCLCYSGTGPPQACLNAMLHSNSRGSDAMFYKVAQRAGVYGLTVSSEFCREGRGTFSTSPWKGDNSSPPCLLFNGARITGKGMGRISPPPPIVVPGGGWEGFPPHYLSSSQVGDGRDFPPTTYCRPRHYNSFTRVIPPIKIGYALEKYPFSMPLLFYYFEH